jgi:hypothetical protein
MTVFKRKTDASMFRVEERVNTLLRNVNTPLSNYKVSYTTILKMISDSISDLRRKRSFKAKTLCNTKSEEAACLQICFYAVNWIEVAQVLIQW